MINDLLIGFFDGLHAGHKLLIDAARKPFAALTFANLPRKNAGFVYPERERIAQLRRAGAGEIRRMDLAQANADALTFCETHLKRILRPARVVVGGDYVFGSDRRDAEFLRRHFPTTLIVPRTTQVSTSRVKAALAAGDVSGANAMLVEPFYRCGTVVPGQRIGAGLGFPTANLQTDANLLDLAEGSYAIEATVGSGPRLRGVAFVGKAKSFPGAKKTTEVHLFDFSADLYGKRIKTVFREFIRPNQYFASAESLRGAIRADVAFAKDYFARSDA